MTDDREETTLERLDGPGARASVPDLVAVLQDVVAGGASVSFMRDLTVEEATEFWVAIAEEVENDRTRLIVARRAGRVVGTVQLRLAMPPNQPHRGDVAKLLVHRSARRLGVGRALMVAVEEQARRDGRTLLVLDTVTGDPAERLYEQSGWTRVGVVPGYALYPDGSPCDTTILYKRL